MSLTKPERRQRIRFRIRKSISGTATNQDYLYLSNKEIYAQLIDDVNGLLCLASSREKK
jgi:large subunit ribosomal protein L18